MYVYVHIVCTRYAQDKETLEPAVIPTRTLNKPPTSRSKKEIGSQKESLKKSMSESNFLGMYVCVESIYGLLCIHTYVRIYSCNYVYAHTYLRI